MTVIHTEGGGGPIYSNVLLIVPATLALEWMWSLRLVRRLRAEQLELVAKTQAAAAADPPA